MASIRSIYIFNTENKILFSRRFPTVENRLKKKMGEEYIAIPSSDKVVSNSFFNKVIREELLQEEFKSKTYKEDLEIDHQKMEDLIKAVDINLKVNNFKNDSECPIVSLDIGYGKNLWPCIYIKKFKLYGVVFPNIDYDKYKSIKQEVFSSQNLSKKETTDLSESELLFRINKLYEEQDLSIVGAFTLIENLLNYIISSKHYEENKLHTLISNMVPFGNIVETNINFMLESLNFLNQRFISNSNIFSNLIDGNKKSSSGINGLSNKSTSDGQEKIKIPGWVTKIPAYSSEKLCITIKEELKMVKYDPDKLFNVILCDINCLADLSRNCAITIPLKEKSKTNYLGNLRIHPCAKLEDQNILNDATRIIFNPPHDEFKMGVFEIENIEQNLLPIIGNFSLKESAQNEVKIYLTVRIDEAAIGKFDYFHINIPLGHFGVIEDTKIMVQVGEVVVHNETTLHWDLQNKVFDKSIVLSGTVIYRKKDPQVGSNSYSAREQPSNYSYKNFQENQNLNSHKDHTESTSEATKVFEQMKYPKKANVYSTSNMYPDFFNDRNINIEEMIKSKNRFSLSSDIMSTNCFCKIHFKLNNYTLSNIEIDKKSLLFYPKLTPKIDIKRQFVSNEYIVWNNMSFINYDVNIPEKPEINLLKINIEESGGQSSSNSINEQCGIGNI